MTDRARAAIVGTGAIAEFAHIPSFAAVSDRVELVAVADIDKKRRKEFARRHGIPHAYPSIEELLDAERPDLVVLCTPPGAHADGAVTALRAGIWVLCEKPPCASLAEAERIRAAERGGGARFATVYQWRFGSGALQMHRLLGDGTLGPVLTAHCQTTWYRDDEYYTVPWRGRWETEIGGPTVSHGIHAIDLLCHLLGPWVEVQAAMARRARSVETEDTSTVIVRFASGALATVLTTVLSPRQQSYLRVDLPQATVEMHREWTDLASWAAGIRGEHWRLTTPDRDTDAARALWPPPPEPRFTGHAAIIADVLEAMWEEREPRTGGESAFAVLELITAMYQAAFTGTSVRRDELVPGNPFHQALHGGDPEEFTSILGPEGIAAFRT